MARTRICAELATGHGGDMDVARAMIKAAAEAGCDAVKVQHYGVVNPSDPQAAWLDKSRLSLTDIHWLSNEAGKRDLQFWVTPFSRESQRELYSLTSADIIIKIASTEAHRAWWHWDIEGHLHNFVVSWPWGERPKLSDHHFHLGATHLTAIPLYPAPLECVQRATLLDGYSDHAIGLAACQHMISQGAQWIEAHLTLGEGQSRVCVWDKHPDDFRKLREYADAVETMRTGVSQVYRDRWRA
jgi:sialic acid synthase SpsE